MIEIITVATLAMTCESAHTDRHESGCAGVHVPAAVKRGTGAR